MLKISNENGPVQFPQIIVLKIVMKTKLMVLIGFILYFNSNDFGVKYDQGFCAYVCGYIQNVVCPGGCVCVFNVVHHILSNDCATKSLNCHGRSLFWVALLETEGERTQKQG